MKLLRLWKWYQDCLAVHPVKTQIISSGLIWGFGDICAQTITHTTAKRQHQIGVSTHQQNPKFSLHFPVFSGLALFHCLGQIDICDFLSVACELFALVLCLGKWVSVI